MVNSLFDHFLAAALISGPFPLLIGYFSILHSLPIEESHLRLLNQALCVFLLLGHFLRMLVRGVVCNSHRLLRLLHI